MRNVVTGGTSLYDVLDLQANVPTYERDGSSYSRAPVLMLTCSLASALRHLLPPFSPFAGWQVVVRKVDLESQGRCFGSQSVFCLEMWFCTE
jgi:hypothetical protein